MKPKRAFTLTELLVVIAIIAALLAILMPAMAKARLQAKIVVVNAELGNIGLALEAYGMDNGDKFPPTRANCDSSNGREHWWAMPQELVKGGYMPGGRAGQSKKVVFADVEDKFNKGFAYKYVAVGPLIFYDGAVEKQILEIPIGFPEKNEGCESYDDPKTSPVRWAVFSIGPKFNNKNQAKEGFPVSKQFWYSPKTGSGIITRLRLKNTSQIGTFQSGR